MCIRDSRTETRRQRPEGIGQKEREIELSQLSGRTAKLGTENQHDSNSNMAIMFALVGTTFALLSNLSFGAK